MNPLHAERRLIVATLRGSSTHRAQEVAELVERTLLHTEKRARSATENIRGYSARVEAGIRKAIGAQPANGVKVRPADVLDAIAWRGPEFFGLRKIPDLKTVKRVLCEMQGKSTLNCIEALPRRHDHQAPTTPQGQAS